MNGLGFKIIKSPDKNYVIEKILEQIEVNSFQRWIDYTDMRYSIFVQSLRRMAKMREIADEAGISFVIFFQGPSGTRYYLSNVNY
jgi:hypothetical protein